MVLPPRAKRHSVAETLVNGRPKGVELLGDEDVRDEECDPKTPGLATNINEPPLVHRVKTESSILALVVSGSRIFAGTAAGTILVWSLDTYQLLRTITAHHNGVLGLSVSQNGQLLFSSGADAIVNVWCTDRCTRKFSIYSTYDIGDLYCVLYSAELNTLYFGAQNTMIQWVDMGAAKPVEDDDLHNHPTQRDHRFFDSKDPAGVTRPRVITMDKLKSDGGHLVEVDRRCVHQYAHNGYVYCMLLADNISRNEQGGETLLSGGGDGTVKLWKINNSGKPDLKELQVLDNGDYSVLTIAIDESFLYVGMLGGDVNVWDLDTCQQIRTFKAHATDVLTLSVGHGKIFSGGANGHARVFNNRYNCISRWEAHQPFVLASAVTTYKGRSTFVTGGNDNCVAVWDIGSENDSLNAPMTNNESLVESLIEFVSYPTVSSRPENTEDCHRGASYLARLFRQLGAVEVKSLGVGDTGNPLVFARFKGSPKNGRKAARILFYGHYDVVAAANEESTWTSDPFNAHGSQSYLYGRGVSDNKGPVLAALYAAADLLKKRQLESDVIFLIEGEEEIGSPGFETTVKKNKHLVGNIDWILIANSYWLNDDFPCLTYGLRGVLHVNVTVKSERPDLHSGVDGSHLVDEPFKDLVTILGQLTGPRGRVLLPSFYHPVLPLSTTEEKHYDAISKTLVHQNPLRKGEIGTSTEELQARWREPSLTIHGIKTSGPNAAKSNIIPRSASASLSIRLVPNQTTAEVETLLTDFLTSNFAALSTSNTLSIAIPRRAEPWLGDPDNTLFKTLEKALVSVWEDIFGGGNLEEVNDNEEQVERERSAAIRKPLYIREGGSIPAIRFLEQEFGAPAAHLPCGQASDCAHLDNERLRLGNLYNSRKIFRRVFGELRGREV